MGQKKMDPRLREGQEETGSSLETECVERDQSPGTELSLETERERTDLRLEKGQEETGPSLETEWVERDQSPETERVGTGPSLETERVGTGLSLETERKETELSLETERKETDQSPETERVQTEQRPGMVQTQTGQSLKMEQAQTEGRWKETICLKVRTTALLRILKLPTLCRLQILYPMPTSIAGLLIGIMMGSITGMSARTETAL